MGPARGEVWWGEAPDERRPYLVLTRDEAIPVLRMGALAPGRRGEACEALRAAVDC
jgi:mRNA-degrading endonuclease toxin of MazEF toxin-antitoxin module